MFGILSNRNNSIVFAVALFSVLLLAIWLRGGSTTYESKLESIKIKETAHQKWKAAKEVISSIDDKILSLLKTKIVCLGVDDLSEEEQYILLVAVQNRRLPTDMFIEQLMQSQFQPISAMAEMVQK